MRPRIIVALAVVAATVPATAAGAPPKIGGFQPGHSAPLKAGTIPYHADFLVGRPRIGKVRAARLVNGRLAVTVAVTYPRLHKRWTALIDDDANYGGRVALALQAGGRRARAHQTKAVPLGSTRQGGHVVQQLVLSTASTRRLLAHGGPLRVFAHVAGRFDQFGDGRPEEQAFANARGTVPVGSERLTAAAGPRDFPCNGGADLVPVDPGPSYPEGHLLYRKINIPIYYNTGPIRFRLCTWSGEPVEHFPWFDLQEYDFPGRNRGGTLSAPRVEDGYVTITFTPDPELGGLKQAQLLFAADALGAEKAWDIFQIHMYFRPFEMRATGDSVTAGWGYLGDGTPPQISGSDQNFDAIQMERCSPNGNSYSNKCSSNSAAGPGDDNTDHRFNGDTGLSNNVSWAAQFANRHHIARRTGQFQTYGNYAVSGGRPEHFVEKGLLSGVLENNVLDYNPDLTVMTLGANPLLASLLSDNKWVGRDARCGFWAPHTSIDTRLIRINDCMYDALKEEHVYERLRAVYRRLLDDPANRIFVAAYPVFYPALQYYAISRPLVNFFDPWVVEVLASKLNAEINRAVQDEAAFARYQGKGDRLFMFNIPRFNFGLPGANQVLLNRGGQTCSSDSSITDVDGPSRQSAATQSAVPNICKGEDYYFESLDGGIHLSKVGASKYADALDAAVQEHGVKLPG